MLNKIIESSSTLSSEEKELLIKLLPHLTGEATDALQQVLLDQQFQNLQTSHE